MTANWFEAKVKYMKVNEDGREKKVNEAYLLDAMSYTEAESRIMHEMEFREEGDELSHRTAGCKFRFLSTPSARRATL